MSKSYEFVPEDAVGLCGELSTWLGTEPLVETGVEVEDLGAKGLLAATGVVEEEFDEMELAMIYKIGIVLNNERTL